MILVIDPAWSGPTGWLKYDFISKNFIYGTLKSKEARDWMKRFDLLREVKTLIIENAFMKKNVATYGKLERAKMLWTQAAIDHFGLTEKNIIEVSPQAWQSNIQRGWRLGMKKDQEAIEYYIRHRFLNLNCLTGHPWHGPTLTNHEISCFGMLAWWEDNHKHYET